MGRPLSTSQHLDLAGRLRAALGPLVRQLRQQGSESITATQLSILESIVRYGPVSLADLSVRERLSPPMITKVVASLDEQGLIERQRDDQDRRVCRVELSSTGRSWIAVARRRRDVWLATRISSLDPADRATLAAAVPLLERLLHVDP